MAGLLQCALVAGVIDGEGIEARRLDVGWSTVGVASSTGWLARGDDGRAGVSACWAEPLSTAAVESLGGVALRVHLTQRYGGPLVVRHAL